MNDAPATSPKICACREVHGFDCQFPDAPAEFPFADKDWCRFHLPLMDAEGNPSPKAEWKAGSKDWKNFENEILKRLSASLPLDDKQDGRADFRQVVFPDDFSTTKLLRDKLNRGYFVNYAGATFGNNAEFSGMIFEMSGCFSGTVFGKGAKFIQTAFSNGADFSNVIFGGNVDFSKARFTTGVNFAEVKFMGVANFTEAIFGKIAKFWHAKFFENAFFTDARFGEEALFVLAKFHKIALFNNAQFGKGANFSTAEFCEEAVFSDAIFGNRARFNEAKFHGSAIFSDTKFGDECSFSKATFYERASFSARKAKQALFDFHNVNFTDAKFCGKCSFENRAFIAGTSFDNVVFKDLVNFHGSEFHEGMSFHNTDFLKTKGANDADTAKLEQAYRTLKYRMETLRARNEEARFFAKEMECRRNRSDIGLFERFAAFGYKHLSNYGQSILRPLYWFGGITVFMGALYFYLLWAMASPPPIHIWGGAPELTSVITFTLEQMFRPFFVWSTSMTESSLALVRAHPLLFPLFASFQSLATIALLTLFLLALRRRFKMD